MTFDAEFLKATLSGDGELTDKIDKILSAHTADITGLKVTNQELKDEKTALEKKVADAKTKTGDLEKQVTDLSTQLKAANPEELKKILGAQHEQEIATLTGDRDTAVSRCQAAESKVNDLMRIAEFEKALDGNTSIRPEVRNILRDTFYLRNPAEIKKAGDEELFLTKDNRTVKDALNAFLQTDEGKFFLLNNNSGGGAPGGKNAGGSSTANPWKKETFNLSEQSKLTRDNPELAARLRSEAGVK